MKTDGHIETPLCGFDRAASHSAGRYVCACGYAKQPAGKQNNARARGSDTERVGNVQPSHAAPAPDALATMERRITELTENGQRLVEAADGWKASAQHFQRERNALEAQLAEAKRGLVNVNALYRNEADHYAAAKKQIERQIVQNNSDAARFRECLAENAALREEVMELYESMGRTR